MILKTAKGAIPGRKWIFYAALRLGTFMMTYFVLIGLSAILLGGGSIVAFIGLIPVAVFLAIRISGSATDEHRPKQDYRPD